MEQLSILSQLNFYNLLNSGYKIIAEKREDDVEMEDEEIGEEQENDENEERNNNDVQKGDVHEGGEGMPDIEDIFKRGDNFSFAECF